MNRQKQKIKMKMKECEDFYQYLNCFSFAFVSHSCPLFLQKQWKGNAGLFWIRRIGHWIPSELKSYFPNPLKDTNFLMLGGLQILEFGPYVSLPDNMFVTIFFFFFFINFTRPNSWVPLCFRKSKAVHMMMLCCSSSSPVGTDCNPLC